MTAEVRRAGATKLRVGVYMCMHAPASAEEWRVSSLRRWCGVSYCPSPSVVDPRKASSCQVKKCIAWVDAHIRQRAAFLRAPQVSDAPACNRPDRR